MKPYKEIQENAVYKHAGRYQIKAKKLNYFDLYAAPEDLQPLPWRVSYCGSGHYFKTRRECLAYAAGRGWIEETEINNGIEHRLIKL